MADTTDVSLYYLNIEKNTEGNGVGFDKDLDQARDILDAHEYSRYSSFKNHFAQQTFLQARRIVKHALSNELGCAPKDILFAYTDTEKPYLNSHTGWHFNISHCSSAIVVALSKAPIGVDVESVSRCQKLWPKAEDFLNTYVKQCIDNADTDEQRAIVFAEHWGCTESYVKLKASAIYREKHRVEIKELAQISEGKRYSFEDVCFTSLNLLDDLRISLALEGTFLPIKFISWRGNEQKTIAV